MIASDVYDYAGFAYSEWVADGRVTAGLDDINLKPTEYEGSLSRAWVAFLDSHQQEKNKILRAYFPYGHRRAIEEDWFVETAYDKWAENEGA
jgi:hypothetical protein